MTIPLTPKEQQLLMFMVDKSVTFKSQDVFKDRHSFCNSMRRLSERSPSLVKSRKQYLNDSKTTFKVFYKLTFDGRFLVKGYLLPATATEIDGDNDE